MGLDLRRFTQSIIITFHAYQLRVLCIELEKITLASLFVCCLFVCFRFGCFSSRFSTVRASACFGFVTPNLSSHPPLVPPHSTHNGKVPSLVRVGFVACPLRPFCAPSTTSPHRQPPPSTLNRKVEVSTVHFRQSVVAEFVAMFMCVRVFQGRVVGAARARGAC